MKTAIELSLKNEIKKNKAHETEIHDGVTALAQRHSFSVTNEQRTNGKLASNTTLTQENPSNGPRSNHGHLTLGSYTANGDKVDKKANEPKAELLLADLVFPIVSTPIPVRHSVAAILQAQEQTMMNVPQPQPSAARISTSQNQPSYQLSRQQWNSENKQAKNKAETLTLPKSPPHDKSVAANKNASCLIESVTYICDGLISIEDEEKEDNWTKEEERPGTMMIFIPEHPTRKSKGPRRFHLDDGDFESKDEEEGDETDG